LRHNIVKKSVQLLLSCAILFFFVFVDANADEISDLVRDGNIAFQANDLSAALEMYREAESQIPKSPELTYNIASVLHEQGKYEEAVDLFKGALNSIGASTEASAHYNLGNSYFRSGDYVKAIESYQNALGLNPDDMDAKYNLELTRKMLKENSKAEQSEDQKQQQQQEKREQEQKQKDDENKDENEDEQNKEGQNQSQDEQQKQKQEQQQGEDDKKMSREDAARILNALRDDEQKQQKKSRRARVQISDPNGEDW